MKRQSAKKSSAPKSLGALRKRTAADVMSSPLVTARVHDSMEDVARLFTEKRVSSVAVLNELDQPVGVLTTTDLAYFARSHPGGTLFELSGSHGSNPSWPTALERSIGTIS